jgi:hypothetical protein
LTVQLHHHYIIIKNHSAPTHTVLSLIIIINIIIILLSIIITINITINTIILLNQMILNDIVGIRNIISLHHRSKLLKKERRSSPLQCQRLNWTVHRDSLLRRGLFNRSYRMTLDAFNNLVDMLRNKLSRNKKMATIRSGKDGLIIPELRLHCLIRFFAGGSYLDICASTGIDVSSFYQMIWETSDAINDCQQLDLIGIPTNIEEANEIAAGFEDISSFGVLDKCVGAVDGFFCRTITPNKDEGNTRSFYSGHYRHMGLNIQAVCDSDLRFIYFSVAAPGSTNDVEAISRLLLFDLIENLPHGYYVIGDSAYNATEHLLPIFCGQERKKKKNDDWNYFASQLRIRIEMSFGLMVMKWQFLRRPLCIKFDNIPKALNAISRLHNYIINSKNHSDRDDHDTIPIIQNNATTTNAELVPIKDRRGSRGTSTLRNMLVKKVFDMGLKRPTKKQKV